MLQNGGGAVAVSADAVKDAHQKMVDLFEEGGIMQP